MPRKTTTIVTCALDGCKAYAEVSDTQEAPEGWYLVVPSTENSKLGHEYNRNNGTFEFHSLKCVEKWAKERRIFEQGGPQHRESSENSIRQQLLDAATDLGEAFTPAQLFEVMGFTGNLKSAESALRTMGKEGVLEIIRQGEAFGRVTPVYKAKVGSVSS